jgi:hypothetical protein
MTNSLVNSISRKDLADFQRWLKTLPWASTDFLYQTYFTEDVREQKLKDLYNRYQLLSPDQRFPKKNLEPKSPKPPLGILPK